jgi:tRNA(Arg) A34 adenosine deaminase TadA
MMPRPLLLALAAARPDADTRRCALVGAVGIRRDGAMVSSCNGSARQKTPSRHAEARVVRKCDRGADVYVARVRRDGSVGCAKPCGHCMAAMRARQVRSVTYTMGSDLWCSVKP